MFEKLKKKLYQIWKIFKKNVEKVKVQILISTKSFVGLGLTFDAVWVEFLIIINRIITLVG